VTDEEAEGGGKGDERLVENDMEGSKVEKGKGGKDRGKVGVVTDGVVNKAVGKYNAHSHIHKEGWYHCCCCYCC